MRNTIALILAVALAPLACDSKTEAVEAKSTDEKGTDAKVDAKTDEKAPAKAEAKAETPAAPEAPAKAKAEEKAG